MSHLFDPGYSRRPFAALVAHYPGADVYPAEDFRLEWGPIFHRGRLDGSARILVLGQDPAAHEAISRRILVGEAGQRVQGFLAKLGIEIGYVMINTFLYSVYGQWGGQKHDGDQNIARYRNDWLDALLVGTQVEAVIALGTLAHHAFDAWLATPNAQGVDLAFQPIKHPTFPEAASASGQMTRAEAMQQMLGEWNIALAELHAAIGAPDVTRTLVPYGMDLDPGSDLARIPERDLPAGIPPWMLGVDAWASRIGPDEETKRATIEVTVPTLQRPWHP